MRAKLFATFTLALGLTVFGADKKSPPVAGTYKGKIEGELATAILKADGSIIVWPSAERPKFTMRGKWKRDGSTLTAKLKDPTGDGAAEGLARLAFGWRLARFLAITSHPFLPFSAERLWTMLGQPGEVTEAAWEDAIDWTAPLTKFHPEIRQAEGELPGGPNCGQMAESIPQILFANLGVASAMLNAFFAYTCGRLGYQEVQFDILEARSLPQFPLQGNRIPQPLSAPE